MDAGRDDMNVNYRGGGGASPLDVAPDNVGGYRVGGDGADEPESLAGGGSGRGREPPPPEVLPQGSDGRVRTTGAPDCTDPHGGGGGVGAAGRVNIVRNGMVPAILWSGWMKRERAVAILSESNIGSSELNAREIPVCRAAVTRGKVESVAEATNVSEKRV
ncbi:hypothetical protein BWQ96_10617 [Gracilariopsis chorda]|uniref:Uncharacterized protein n=1 Tax=Gracilariopsis chorda TaxID=448386 RepID=A0A2V3IC67_9FLOR|nr:hypothetical protein BWQ96_10617 [Gracilariopsis chorda]|eukprot:PXF39683.1 hypothetical protein BWQ96_10617 [Gracilariopsis chorda]